MVATKSQLDVLLDHPLSNDDLFHPENIDRESFQIDDSYRENEEEKKNASLPSFVR